MSKSQRINKIGEVLRRERRQNERLDHLQPLVWTQEQAGEALAEDQGCIQGNKTRTKSEV